MIVWVFFIFLSNFVIEDDRGGGEVLASQGGCPRVFRVVLRVFRGVMEEFGGVPGCSGVSSCKF